MSTTQHSFHLCPVPDEKPEDKKQLMQEQQENENTETKEEDKVEIKAEEEDGKPNDNEGKENKQDSEVDGEAKQTEKRFVLVSSPLDKTSDIR